MRINKPIYRNDCPNPQYVSENTRSLEFLSPEHGKSCKSTFVGLTLTLAPNMSSLKELVEQALPKETPVIFSGDKQTRPTVDKMFAAKSTENGIA